MLVNAARYDMTGTNHNLKMYSDRLQELGIMKGSFVSHTKMFNLNLGTMGQLWNMIRKIAKKFNITEDQLLEMGKDYE